MAHAKNQKSVGRPAFTLENSLASSKNRRRARHAREAANNLSDHSRQIIVSVIGLVLLAVILTGIFAVMSTPDRVVTRKLEAITADYYENYFYKNILAYAPTETSLAQIMDEYTTHGFSEITLSQLLLFDDQRHASSATILTKYCNPERTRVIIYPDPPYGRTDYHVDYKYSCEF